MRPVVFTTLIAAAKAAELADDLQGPGPLTVFAPTDDAFSKLSPTLLNNLLRPENKETLESILLYHVVQGAVNSETAIEVASQMGDVSALNNELLNLSLSEGDLFINSSKVISADVNASNGIIHVIDSVLVPSNLNDEIARLSRADIVETAKSAGIFNTLVAAVGAAELVDALKSKGPFTVFAPTDQAFAKLGSETIQSLLKPENKPTLTKILLYHVVSAEVVAKDAITLAKEGAEVETLNSQKIQLSLRESEDAKSLFINDSKVIQADVLTSNGVIHVIDTVLIPSDDI